MLIFWVFFSAFFNPLLSGLKKWDKKMIKLKSSSTYETLKLPALKCKMAKKNFRKTYLWIGESGNKSSPSETDELGLGVASASPFLIASTFFFTLPLLFSNLLVSMDAALLLTDFPGFASGFIIHHDDFPVPSFCTRMNRLCSERLCRIEFWNKKQKRTYK